MDPVVARQQSEAEASLFGSVKKWRVFCLGFLSPALSYIKLYIIFNKKSMYLPATGSHDICFEAPPFPRFLRQGQAYLRDHLKSSYSLHTWKVCSSKCWNRTSLLKLVNLSFIAVQFHDIIFSPISHVLFPWNLPESPSYETIRNLSPLWGLEIKGLLDFFLYLHGIYTIWYYLYLFVVKASWISTIPQRIVGPTIWGFLARIPGLLATHEQAADCALTWP